MTLHDRLLALAEELDELAETLHDPTFSTVLAAADEARAIAAELERNTGPYHIAGIGAQAHPCSCSLGANHT